jgi:hypothetical protein
MDKEFWNDLSERDKFRMKIWWRVILFLYTTMIALIIYAIMSGAHAEQSSVLCKTNDTNEYIDIVSKEMDTNDVLFQVQGGKFYDGMSEFKSPIFKVYVPLDNGTIILLYNVNTREGFLGAAVNNEKQSHPISCVFR